MRWILALVLVAAALIYTSSCASILKGTVAVKP